MLIKKLLDSRIDKIDKKYVKRCNSYERTYYITDFISGVYKWLFYDKNGYAIMYDNDG
jgi:hypothetical protein